MKKIILPVISFLLLATCACIKDNYVIPKGSDSVPTEKRVVKVMKDSDGLWQLTVDGQPFYVNGAATNKFFNETSKFGGNTIRLYSPTASNTKEIMDAAYQANLMVYLGLGMAAAESFDYSNAEKVAAQKERIIGHVKQYMHHPALLCWSLGNEIEASNDSNAALWKAVGELADTIRAMDADHPITCALAGSGTEKIKNLAACSNAIDIISVNAYYPVVGNISGNILDANVNLPYLVTEFGPRGTWNMSPEPSRILPWGDNYSSTSKALVEETSSEKEAVYLKVWQDDIKANESKGCLGSFVFVWGYQTHGEVLNWYGTHTKDKYSFGVCDAMQFCWTGKYPEIRAPRIESRNDLTLNGKKAEEAIYITAGSTNSAKVIATSPAELNLHYHWFLFKEGDKMADGSIPDGIEGLIEDNTLDEITFKAPSSAGGYRLYVHVLDDVNKKAASACIPFCVQ